MKEEHRTITAYYYWDDMVNRWCIGARDMGSDDLPYRFANANTLLEARNRLEEGLNRHIQTEITYIIGELYPDKRRHDMMVDANIKFRDRMPNEMHRKYHMDFWGVSVLDYPQHVHIKPERLSRTGSDGRTVYTLSAKTYSRTGHDIAEVRRALEIALNNRYQDEKPKHNLPDATFLIDLRDD